MSRLDIIDFLWQSCWKALNNMLLEARIRSSTSLQASFGQSILATSFSYSRLLLFWGPGLSSMACCSDKAMDCLAMP